MNGAGQRMVREGPPSEYSAGDGQIAEIRARIAEGMPVRRTLAGGRLRIDRQLPFLIIHRLPVSDTVSGTERLVTGEASYLVASGARAYHSGLQRLVGEVVESLASEFGAFLIVEVWAAPADRKQEEEEQESHAPPGPRFRIVSRKKGYPARTIEALREALGTIRVNRRRAEVAVERRARLTPPGMRPLISPADEAAINCLHLGIEVDPVWVNTETDEDYPLLFRHLRRSFGRALKRALHEFTVARTTRRPAHYLAFGPRSVTRAVWDVDAKLAEINGSFDLLLAVTPVNPEQAWREFHKGGNGGTPEFFYRPIDVDPDILKRELYKVPIERVEDPTLAHLFIEKREELDRCLTMLHDRGTRRMRYESMQLFDVPSADLVRLAHRMLELLPTSDRSELRRRQVTAAEFAQMAQEEYYHYSALLPQFSGVVQVRKDITQGLLVSNGALLVGAGSRFPRQRAAALLQHEVGTHVLTYYNGKAQPLQLLYCGLAGYDEFQEGTAVLAEYLVNGLSGSRLRVLAARVLAVHAMLEGATFAEVFRMLTKGHGFTQRSAFTVTMRIFRGGGLTKDAVYLRGLERVLEYLREGGDVSALFVGKIAARHVPIVRELQLRGVLRQTPLLPRYLSDSGALDRLERVRRGMTTLDLIPNRKTTTTR